MSQFDYTRSQAVAKRLIERYGQAMTLRHVATGDYSEGAAAQTTSDESVVGITEDYSLYEQQNSLVGATDRKVIIAAMVLAAAPAIDDQLVIGAEAGKIVHVRDIAPGGVDVIYELQVRF